ncbi:thiol-disulfide oxidoreductase [Halalkalibacillus sediminis]|uniref:Thiol-disulfide oxidoreductase n=1 Tax=Halalkalibacillus sediminis TaxID=2018042 RepID=A0A2I0QX10_9BACI|nr:thiol-disulfide oxidoreductase ResA [Halalkalibacillus sediminis]PKR78887.1 thiol-disulfide oxidoreductase [Halalkalibacillus sediminis]
MNPKKKKRYIFRTVVLSTLVLTLVAVLVVNAQKDNPALTEGDQAPNFKLDRLDTDGSIELEELKGKGVMINFWATYCEPCKKEMPYMDELYQEYEEKGIEIIAVSVDKNELVINNFYNRLDLSFPSVHDKSSVIMDLYQVVPLPTSYFVNPDGSIERIVKGPLTLDRLETYLQEIVPQS